MKLDEIGQTIKDEELTGVLNNLLWKVSQEFLLINRQTEIVETSLTMNNTQYLTTNEGNLVLKNDHEQHLSALKSELRLRNYFLKTTLAKNQFLWPLSVNGMGNTIQIRIPEELFTELYNRKFKKYKVDYYDFRNQIYLKIAEGMEEAMFLLTYLTGSAPFKWDNAGKEKGRPRRSQQTRMVLEKVADQEIDFRTLKAYLASQSAVAKVKLEGQFDQNQGITALTLQHIDLNPNTTGNIGANILELINVLVGYYLMKNSCANDDLVETVKASRQKDLTVANDNPFKRSELIKEMHDLLEDLNHFAQEYGYGKQWNAAYETLRNKLDDVMQTPAAQILRNQGALTSLDYVRQMAIELQQKNHVETELSDNSLRLLQAAFKRGIDYQVISATNDLVQVDNHFVTHGLTSERDQAVLPQMWSDKQIAKQMVGGLNIQLQQAWEVKNNDEASHLYPLIKDKAVVIKNAVGHTNKAGTLYRLAPTKREFLESVALMLKETNKVLVEQVVAGSAYQAMVLNGKVVSVIERIPENVVGDGRSTIGQLVENKKLTIGRNEHQTLISQGVDLDNVGQRGIQTLLRYDAFSGTNFDSYDALDDIDVSYIEILQKIANKLKMRDGFIDIVISNLYQPYTSEHPELVTFLGAHADACLKKHEEMLMNQHRDLSGQIVESLLHD